MKKFLIKAKCYLFGHKFKPDIYYDENVQKINCERCKKKFGINHQMKALIEWDEELESVMKLIYPDK